MENLWTYADWRRQSTPAARLERLRLHIEEVSQHEVGSKTRSGAAKFPATAYLERLEAKEEKLAGLVDPSDTGAGSVPIARSRAAFRRSR